MNLTSCPDCDKSISLSAETCPHCGKLFAREPTEVTPGPRWSWTIYWGIVLFVVIPGIISAVISTLIFLLIAGAVAARR